MLINFKNGKWSTQDVYLNIIYVFKEGVIFLKIIVFKLYIIDMTDTMTIFSSHI